MIWQLVSTLLGIQTTILHPGHHIHCKVCPYKWSSRGCRDTVRDWTHTCTSVDTTHVRQWTQHMYVSGHNTCTSVDTTHVRQWTQHMYVSGHNTCTSVDTTHVRQWTQHMYVSGHNTCTSADTTHVRQWTHFCSSSESDSTAPDAFQRLYRSIRSTSCDVFFGALFMNLCFSSSLGVGLFGKST